MKANALMGAAVALGMLLAPSARAGHQLGLPEALALARKNNRDLAAARARLRQAQVGIEQARTALLPTLAAQGKYTHNYKEASFDLGTVTAGFRGLAATLTAANAAAPPSAQNPALAPALEQFLQSLTANAPTPITIQKREQLDSSLALAAPVLAPSAWSSLSAARSQAEAAHANFEVTATDVLFSAAQGFFAAAGADELVLAREHAVEVAQLTRANAQAKLDAGSAKRTDVNQAHLALLRAEQAVREARDTRAQAYRSLATLLQLEQPFIVAPPVTAVAPAPPLDRLTAHALRARPELQSYRASVDAANAQRAAADWRWAPTLTAFGNARLSNYASFTGDRYAWALGLQLDWLLFDAGVRDTQRHLAIAQRDENQQRAAAEADAIRDQIKNAAETLQTRQAALATAEQSATLAHDTLALSRAEYDAGTATQLDVLQSQDALVSAEVARAQARFDLALARITLERTAGTFPEAAVE
jgi:outer membrane protein TolC